MTSPDCHCLDCERAHTACVCVSKSTTDRITDDEHELLSKLLAAKGAEFVTRQVRELALRQLVKIDKEVPRGAGLTALGYAHVTDRGVASICAWHLEQLGKADTLPPPAAEEDPS